MLNCTQLSHGGSEVIVKFITVDYRKNISLFEKTMKAQTLIDEHYGRGNNLSKAAALLSKVVIADKNYVPAYIEMSRVVLSGGHLVNYEFRARLRSLSKMLYQKIDELEMLKNKNTTMRSLII